MSSGFDGLLGGLFGGNNLIWILLLLVFVLPNLGLGSGLGGLFGGNSWLFIILLIIFVLPSLGLGDSFGGLGNLLKCGC